MYSFSKPGVRSGLITPNQKYIICGLKNGSIGVYDYKTKQETRLFKHVDTGKKLIINNFLVPINCIDVTSESKFLIVKTSNFCFKLIDLDSFQMKFEYNSIRDTESK